MLEGEIGPLLSEADRAIGAINTITTVLPNPELFVAMFIQKEALLSSQIEGTQSSLVDVLGADEEHVPTVDVAEVVNYVKAMRYGLDRLPNTYLPELIAANDEATVRGILETHFISPAAQAILLRDPFTPEDFEAFIAERQRTLQDAIESLLVKERIDLPIQLRELDERIEKTELNLRNVVDQSLESDMDLLPHHVVQKVRERIDRALKKNAALDSEFYDTLKGMLEYCDLREIQDIITGKTHWNRFSNRFVNKETLNGKFGQLAELRNGIRHSRAVDEVTRKEGEAAILWFEKILST